MEHQMKFRYGFTRSFPILLGILAVGGLLLAAQPTSAQISGETVQGTICMQNIFGTPATNSNRLNCTANDIRLSKALSVSPSTCTEHTRFNLTATFEVIVTANSRYDAGFFFRIDGGPNARGDGNAATGECSLSWLIPGIPPALPTDNPSADIDSCGDLNAGTYTEPTLTNPESIPITFYIPNVLCEKASGTNFLRLPNCTSWHSNQGTPCTAPLSARDFSHVTDFHPDTKSKCVCDDTFTVPVVVEEATLTVLKTASPDYVPETGGTVTYTVQITNDASIESVTIQTLEDSIYGNLANLQPCGAGQPSLASPICTPGGLSIISCLSLVGQSLGPSASKTCTFNAFVSGNSGQKITDTVEVCSIQPSDNDAQICGSDDADVYITDVFTAPTLTKTAQSATCQVDVTYQVTVTNNSTTDTLTLNSLTDDKFGSISAVHAAGESCSGLTTCGEVVSTTCVKDSSAATCEAGGTIAPQGNCSCTFVGRTNSCNFSLTDTVTGTTTDGDKHCSASTLPEPPPSVGEIACNTSSNCPPEAPNCVANQSLPYGSATVTVSTTLGQ